MGADLMHAPGCTATPTATGERPYLLIVRNVRTGHMDVTCTVCHNDQPKEHRWKMTIAEAVWWKRCEAGGAWF
jgi:hypothetical protein